MLDYDFGKYAVVNRPQVPAGKIFQPAFGLPLKEIVTANPGVIAACNAENTWSSNNIVVIDRKVQKRTGCGVNTSDLVHPTGIFSVLVLDYGQRSVRIVELKDGEPVQPINFQTGVHGPLLVKDKQPVERPLLQSPLRTKPGEVNWDPNNTYSAMTAAGIMPTGELVFFVMAGNPETNNECNIYEFAQVFAKLGVSDGCWMGASGDSGLYTRLTSSINDEQNWIIGKARNSSSMGQMFPPGKRPLNIAFLVREN
ncbi:MAG: phosphodiester glycosidase family protein [bacterium]